MLNTNQLETSLCTTTFSSLLSEILQHTCSWIVKLDRFTKTENDWKNQVGQHVATTPLISCVQHELARTDISVKLQGIARAMMIRNPGLYPGPFLKFCGARQGTVTQVQLKTSQDQEWIWQECAYTTGINITSEVQLRCVARWSLPCAGNAFNMKWTS